MSEFVQFAGCYYALYIYKKYNIQSFQKGCFGNWALGTWKPLFRGRPSKALYCLIQFQCPIPEVYHEINQACIIMQLLYLMHLDTDRKTDRHVYLESYTINSILTTINISK